jgi:hypothetical protein
LLALSKSAKLEGEVTTLVIQSASETGDAERLAGCAADEEVDFAILIFLNSREIAMQRDFRVVVFKDGAWKRLNLREERRLPAHVMPSGGGGLDAAAYRPISHV